jgi:hypothetical protein
MTVEDLDKIDFTLFDSKSGTLYLVVSDHLGWDELEGEHLLTLQEKLNTYLAFIDTGQIYRDLPKAAGSKIVIRVIGKYPLSDEARKFYRLAGKFIEDAGYSLQFDPPTPNEYGH